MPILSENFVRSEVPKLMRGRDERVFRDAKLTGFLLRVRRKADDTFAKTFFVDWRAANGKREKLTIGDHETYPADEARDEARTMLQAVKRGDDPKAEREAKKAQPTWEDLVAAFRAKFLPKKKPSTAKRYEGVIRRILTPAFKGRRIGETDFTRPIISTMYTRHAQRQADANNAMRVLSRMMTFAIGEGWRSTNPCKGIERYKNRDRERWLDEKELPLFIAALAKAPADPTHDLIRFLAVCGWRVSDALLLDWSQVNLRELSVTLQDSATKNRPSVLSTDAAMLIERQRGRVGAVFSNRAGVPVSYKHLRKTLDAVLKAAGIVSGRAASDGVIEYVTPHTLRHTAASWASLGGADAFMLRDTFAWKTLAMANKYVKKADSRARHGSELLANAINIHGRPSAEIIGIAGAKR